MKNYKQFILLFVMILFSSCEPYGGQLRYRFKFINNSDEDIYIVIDCITDDQSISPGSLYDYVFANNWRYVDSLTPWADIIKDSAFIYVLDASLIDLLPLEKYLTEDKCETITQEMKLDRITVHHKDASTIFTLSYP